MRPDHRIITTPITFDEYMRMPETNEPIEVVDGILHRRPSLSYRDILVKGNILRAFLNLVEPSRAGIVIGSPADLIIRKSPRFGSRQPDVMDFSDRRAGFPARDDPNRLFNEGVAPDLVVELLADARVDRSFDDVLADYASIAIDEVWFVDQAAKEVHVLALDWAAYRLSGVFKPGDRIVSGILRGIEMDVSAIFGIGVHDVGGAASFEARALRRSRISVKSS